MKLVEILARELVEWPEGSGEMWQSAHDLEVYAGWGSFYPSMAAEDRGKHNRVTRAMWEAEREKMEDKTEWDGVGLPPVGTVCEVHDCGKYREVSVVVHDGEYALCRLGEGEYMAGISGSFRPIRTPEKIAAQDREQAITDLMRTTCIRMGEAARIYDAGYRRQ